MFQAFGSKFLAFITALPFTGATWFVIAIMTFFTWLFMKASNDPISKLSWEDLILDQSNNKASPYKLGYLIGVIVGTWVIITFADQGKLTWDIFCGYLTFLLGGAGWNSYLKGKNAPDDIGKGPKDGDDK